MKKYYHFLSSVFAASGSLSSMYDVSFLNGTIIVTSRKPFFSSVCIGRIHDFCSLYTDLHYFYDVERNCFMLYD